MTDSARTWLVECYTVGIEREAVARAGERAREAAVDLRKDGRVVVYVGAIFVADDEVVFHAFVAEDPALVGEASRRAEIRFERIVESVSVPTAGIPATLHSLLAGIERPASAT